MRKGGRLKNEMMWRWEYTSDDTGACVSKFAAQVVRDVNRERAIRVCVRRGDGKKLVEMLRSGLPNTKIELTSMASSLSAKLDVSVQVLEGQNEKLGFELCNVEKRRAAVATPWTLTEYHEWAKNHNTDPDLAGIKDVEECLRMLLGYAQTGDWDALEEAELATRRIECKQHLNLLGKELEMLEMGLSQGKKNDPKLLRLKSAINAGIDAARESIDRAKNALQSKN
jgi:hypothetical protein